MKKNRTYPFGYMIRNGRFLVNEKEAAIVRQIFSDYIGGSPLSAIANTLNTDGVLYSVSSKKWSKSTVKRILDNQKYIGQDDLPAIIDASLFSAAQTRKSAQFNKQDSAVLPHRIIEIKNRAFCKQCGERYKRILDSRYGERWRCKNDDCKPHKRITDMSLQHAVIIHLNNIIKQPDIIQAPPPPSDEFPALIMKKENEFRRELSKTEIDSERVKSILLDIAAAQYRLCRDTDSTPTETLRKIFENAAPLAEFDADLFTQTASKVLIAPDGNIELELINKQIISPNEISANR